MNTDASIKIQMIKGSLRCFVFGVLGLLPVIGPPFALAALWISGRIRVKERSYWNAARPYRIWGITSAAVGAIIWSGVDTLLIYHSIYSYASN